MPSSNTPRATATQRAPKKATKSTQSAVGVRSAPRDASEYTPTTWGGPAHFEVTTPSGQSALVRNLEIEELMEVGLLDAINGLSGIVEMEVLPKARGQKQQDPQVDMAKVMKNAPAMNTVLGLVNTIVCLGVVAPSIAPVVDRDGHKIPHEDRVVGKIYVDSIPMKDRFFLFNELTGGLDQLASFRS